MEIIKEIIENGFKNGYSKEHKITEIMFELFPSDFLIANDEREHKIAEEIYDYYVEWYLNSGE